MSQEEDWGVHAQESTPTDVLSFGRWPRIEGSIDPNFLYLGDTNSQDGTPAPNPLDTYRDTYWHLENFSGFEVWAKNCANSAAAPEPEPGSRPSFVFSDSGYGSLATRSVALGSLSIIQELDRPTQNVDDSGYGSLATKSVTLGKLTTIQELDEPAQNMADVSTDAEAQETRTIFSDAASLCQHPDVDQYITAFANELACYIPPELDASDPSKISPVLDHLLKAFAVRLGHESPGPLQRQLMYLVYRFRRSVTSPNVWLLI